MGNDQHEPTLRHRSGPESIGAPTPLPRSFEFSGAVYPVGGTSRHSLPPPAGSECGAGCGWHPIAIAIRRPGSRVRHCRIRLVANDDYGAAASGRQGFFNRTKLADGPAKTDPEGWVGQARIMIDGVGVRVNVWKPTENPIVHAGVFGGFTARANATAYGLDSGADWEQSAEMPESGLVCERCFPELWPGARSRAS